MQYFKYINGLLLILIMIPYTELKDHQKELNNKYKQLHKNLLTEKYINQPKYKKIPYQ